MGKKIQNHGKGVNTLVMVCETNVSDIFFLCILCENTVDMHQCASKLAGQESIFRLKTGHWGKLTTLNISSYRHLELHVKNVVSFHVFHLFIHFRCAEVVKMDPNGIGLTGTHLNLEYQPVETCMHWYKLEWISERFYCHYYISATLPRRSKWIILWKTKWR